jgi:hypothetical protein
MGKQSACYVAVLCGVVALLACGSTGPQGPAGPPADRSKLYCNTTALTLDDSHLTVSAYCNSKTDLPWTGDCGVQNPGAGIYLESSQPASWNDTTTPAGWQCTWVPYNAVPIGVSASAEMCCYNMGGT